MPRIQNSQNFKNEYESRVSRAERPASSKVKARKSIQTLSAVQQYFEIDYLVTVLQ